MKVDWTDDQKYYRMNFLQGLVACIVAIILLSFVPINGDGSPIKFNLRSGVEIMGLFSPFVIAKLLADHMSDKGDPRK